MNFWIKNTSGKRDAVLTMTLMGVVVVFLKVLMMGINFKFGTKSFDLGTIDAATVAAVLTPTLTAYVARRYTDKTVEVKQFAATAALQATTPTVVQTLPATSDAQPSDASK